MKDFKYLFAYLIPVMAYISLFGQGVGSWSLVIMAFVLLPITDQLLPASKENHPESDEESHSQRIFFDWLLYICLPIVCFFIFQYLKIMQTGQFSTFEMLGKTASTGILLGTMGINVAHELGHRESKAEQFLAHLLMLPALYLHFFIEHNRGHHKYVSTDRDPASAKLNETVYAFWWRSISGQIQSAWHLETERLRKLNLPVFSWHNGMLQYFVYQSAYLFAVAWYFGIAVLPYALAVAAISVLLLESVNYIEHYGLRRKLLPGGRPEPVSPVHSWNSNHEMGRIFLFELTRHSDHHFKSTRKYQILRHLDESPQLPFGYPSSILMALVPPLWFRVMNPIIQNMSPERAST